MEFTLTVSHFREIICKSYSLDHIFLLKMVQEQLDLLPLMTESAKITALMQSLVRKGLITEDLTVTLDGKALLDFVNSPTTEIKIVKIKTEDDFDKFWKVFPPTDTFEYKGHKFNGNRALRINKEGCKLKLKAILNTGEYTIDQIVEAIEYDVLCKKRASVKTSTNKLTYMQNALTYLNQLSFDPFIELAKQSNGEEEEETQTTGRITDI